MSDELLTTEMAAKHLSVSTGTLANWRYQSLGPTYVKVGGNVRYRECDLERWMSRREVTPMKTWACCSHSEKERQGYFQISKTIRRQITRDKS